MVMGQLDDSTPSAQYFKLWKPHAGVWIITVKEEAQQDIELIYSYRPSPTKLCYVSRGTDEDGAVLMNGIHGYDPANDCWVDMMFAMVAESPLYIKQSLRAKLSERLQVGSKVSVDTIEYRGEDIRESKGVRVYEIVEKDRLVYSTRNRTTPEGESLPDLTITCERKN